MRRVGLIGTGLVGGSIGLALRRAGIEVCGFDHDPGRLEAAVAAGAIDDGFSTIAAVADGTEVVVVAVPVGQLAASVIAALDADAAVVTDVGSVKAPVVREVQAARPARAPRFVGGHPMAGSEQDGITGADVDLFTGATWVLTPTDHTEVSAFTAVRTLVGLVGAEVLAVEPEQHDALVAMVSHVPQLAATTLMDVAATRGAEHATLLRLAAGGFRDMTRIAAGHPSIWPDICVANRDAIVAALDEYRDALDAVRALVDTQDRSGLLEVLERARTARRSLPRGLDAEEALAELRVPIPDRPGSLAEVTTLAGTIGVNIADVEIAHSAEGGGGVLVLVVAARHADAFAAALSARGYHPARTELP